ncbi:hypothetical protein C8R46DRAFT_1228901 [Mycena filopes]|nr:hypothetical protein C8R46DRAFT_1228901 [Mycena filopes]
MAPFFHAPAVDRAASIVVRAVLYLPPSSSPATILLCLFSPSPPLPRPYFFPRPPVLSWSTLGTFGVFPCLSRQRAGLRAPVVSLCAVAPTVPPSAVVTRRRRRDIAQSSMVHAALFSLHSSSLPFPLSLCPRSFLRRPLTLLSRQLPDYSSPVLYGYLAGCGCVEAHQSGGLGIVLYFLSTTVSFVWFPLVSAPLPLYLYPFPASLLAFCVSSRSASSH